MRLSLLTMVFASVFLFVVAVVVAVAVVVVVVLIAIGFVSIAISLFWGSMELFLFQNTCQAAFRNAYQNFLGLFRCVVHVPEAGLFASR